MLECSPGDLLDGAASMHQGRGDTLLASRHDAPMQCWRVTHQCIMTTDKHEGVRYDELHKGLMAWETSMVPFVEVGEVKIELWKRFERSGHMQVVISI